MLSPRKIVLLYAICGLLWVAATTTMLELHQYGSLRNLWQHGAAGVAFVAATAVLLHQLISRYASDLAQIQLLIGRAFEVAPSGIAVVRAADNMILLVNSQFEAMSGYSRGELLRRTTMELKLWENQEAQQELIQRLQAEKEVHGFAASFRRANGELMTGKVTARSIEFQGTPCTIAFIEDTTELQQIASQVEALTRFDSMTGLPNQYVLHEHIEQLIAINSREEERLAVLSLALERCPSPVSSMGHNGCDELLRRVTARLQQNLRETDTLAVLQKGEFGILLPNAENKRSLLTVVTKLLESINEPISIGDAEFQLHAHIGIALFPSDGRTVDVLLQHAHLAMGQALVRSGGESHFQFYSEEMNQEVLEQLQVESSILKGIRAGEFFVCYQPLFDRDGVRLIGMEALARWQHPAMGLVGPDKFIPVAEANGTIIQLGEQVLEQALQNCRYWRDTGFPCLTVAVNLSARQLKDRQLTDRVSRLLALTGLPPEALCLELTESMLMEHSNENIDQIFRLKELGILLAIDDFGTGYSSLAHLKHLPVDSIKIDRSFVKDLETNIDDRAIVTAIIAMARSLHLRIVAEGVETEQQHRLLQELGCDALQGYHFGKPMDRNDFDRFLARGMTVNITDEPLQLQNAVKQPAEETAVTAVPDYRPLRNIADITIRITPLSPGDRLNTALERFQTDSNLYVLPVVDRHRVVGILNRSEFFEEQVVGRIGYAFHINHSKKLRELMRPVPLVIDSEYSIEEAAQALHGNFGSMRLENICVARRGIYQGVLDVRTLVEAITALNLELAKGANPLTGLPGNESIQREISRRVESGLPFEIVYIDIDNFKPYNDFYGFERGDMVIQVVGEILRQYEAKSLQNFCGHIGGDDFILLTGPGTAVGICRQVLTEFEARLPILHGSSDVAKGCYTSFNRKGELETFGLLSLSVAIISTGSLMISSYPQLASLASEVKKSAKKVKGPSIVLKDSSEQPAVMER